MELSTLPSPENTTLLNLRSRAQCSTLCPTTRPTPLHPPPRTCSQDYKHLSAKAHLVDLVLSLDIGRKKRSDVERRSGSDGRHHSLEYSSSMSVRRVLVGES